MTRDPRADELPAESMDLLDSLATYIRGPGFEHASLEIADKISEIRAYLDEPQGDPQYVWRVLVACADAKYCDVFQLLSDAKTCAANVDYEEKPVSIERAQIGPWEALHG